MQIKVECPLCETKANIEVDNNIRNASGMTTISIPEKLICKHSFQAFVDSKFNVRCYQKVNIEVKKKDVVKVVDISTEEKFKSLF